ncbi:MAG: penicillin-binding protein activator [Pseudomonadota bacterium]
MVAVFRLGRKLRGAAVGLWGLAALSACDVGVVGTGPILGGGETVEVALLLPQSASAQGPALAESFENAARLAMADLGDTTIDLRVYDTAGNAEQAAAVTSRAIADGAQVILGPLFADAAGAAGAVAATQGVNVLSFSNNPSVAGGGVYLLGSTFQNTADRLVSYAARSGRNDILIVHGQSAAEELGRDAILRAIGASGARLAGTAPFPLNQQGLISAIPAIADQVDRTAASVVFMTSGNDGAIPFLAQLLPENGVDTNEVQFIGLQRLDIPAGALQLDGLQGAWFALPDPGVAELFRSRYLGAYGVAPHPLAGLAYDGIAAIGALSAAGEGLGTAALTRSSGFAGVNGVFRFRPNGTNERGLAVAQVQDKQVVIIDPAPRSFDSFGF